MLINDAVDKWCEWMSLAKGRSEKTVLGYRSDMKQLSEGITTVDQFTLNHMRNYLADHMSLSAATRRRRAAAAKSFAKFCARQEWSDGGRMDRLMSPKVPKRVAEHYPVEEVLKLLDGMKSESMPDPMSARDWALLELLYGAGLRIDEACNMDLGDVDVDSMKIRVLGKGGKERVLPIGPKQLGPLTVWMMVRHPKDPQEDALFLGARGERLEQRTARRAMGEACKRMGVQALSPHALRHSAATHMLEGGAGLRQLGEFLGHSSLATTERYTHIAMKRMVSVFREAHPRERAAS